MAPGQTSKVTSNVMSVHSVIINSLFIIIVGVANMESRQKFTSSVNHSLGMDPLFMAMTLFKHRRFEDCVQICDDLLEKNPKDQVRNHTLSLKRV